MLQLRSVLKVADNTGSQEAAFISVLGHQNKKIAYLGDIIRMVVKKADPNGLFKKGDLVLGVVARTRKEKRRMDGSFIRFSDNAVVLIDNLKDKNPKGTRVFGPVAKELKERGFSKIISLAKEVY